MNHKASELLDELNITRVEVKTGGVFGICYSILTWSGVGKGLSLAPSSWVKSLSKLFENGHATTFFYDYSEDKITLTGISDNGWVFETGTPENIDWARTTPSSTTFVYYLEINKEIKEKYYKIKEKLTKSNTSYSALWPNLPISTTQYENCVSHSHHLMADLGIVYWPKHKGWWVPSIANWADWLTSFAPIYRHAPWKYKLFQSKNTHIP